MWRISRAGRLQRTREPRPVIGAPPAVAEAVEPRLFLAAGLAVDLNTNTASSNPQRGVEFNGAFYFVADDGINGQALWKSDGTAAGTLRLANVAPGNSTNSIAGLARVGDALFFGATNQLWKTDGTAAGTVAVAPMAIASRIVDVGGVAYFAGRDPARPEVGYELYKSDGTAAGTVLVKDIYPGIYPGTVNTVANSYPSYLAAMNGRLYFFAVARDTGMELWQSDGTEAGTTIVKDINPGSVDSNKIEGVGYPSAYTTVVGNTLYFAAERGTGDGRELYKSDGTAEGTDRVKDINFFAGSDPTELTPFGDGIVFATRNGLGRELWRSDGTDAGTVLVKDIVVGSVGSNPVNLVNAGGTLFFAVGTGPGFPMEVYKSDGTADGTVPLTTTRPGGVPRVVPPRVPSPEMPQIVAAGPGERRVFFAGYLGTSNRPLWTSDGTPEGTVPVADEASGAPAQGGSQFLVGAPGGRAFFGGAAPGKGTEPFIADAATATARLVTDLNATTLDASYTGVFARRDGSLLLAARDATGWGVWRSDGTAAGTSLLTRVTPGGVVGSTPTNPLFTEVGNLVYFIATDAESGTELWKTDGTPGGTVRVKDIDPGPDSSAPQMLTALGDTLVFWARTDEAAYEPWRSDGTEAGTAMIKDIWPGPWDSIGYAPHRARPGGRAVYGGLLYFSAEEQVGADRVSSVWRTDGTEAGTVRLTDTSDPNQPRYPEHFTVSGGRLFFSAVSARPVPGLPQRQSGNELWVTDGTAAGTRLVKEINASNEDANPRQLTDVHGTLYFAALVPVGSSGASYYTLWRSDGTEAGTVRVGGQPPGEPTLFADELENVNGTLYFRSAVQTGSQFNDTELWKTDPSRPDAVRVIDLNPGFGSSAPTQLTAAGPHLYFTATAPGSLSDLWRTNGTEAGTVKVLDFYPGEPSVNPGTAHLTARLNPDGTPGGTVYLTGDSRQYGYELWRVDSSGAVLGADGTLTVTGTDARDDISVRRSGTDISVVVNGAASTFAAEDVRRVEVEALGGADTVALDGELTISATPVQAHVDGGEGGATLNFYGRVGGDNIIFTSANTIQMGGGTTFESVGVNLFGLTGGDYFLIHPDAPVRSISGDAGDDIVELRGTEGPDQVTVLGREIRRQSGEDFRTITHAGVEGLWLNALGGNDEFLVGGNEANTRLTLNGGAGDDEFRFGGSLSMDMAVILGPVEVNGGGGNDSVSFLDARAFSTPATHTLTPSSYGRSAYVPGGPVPGLIHYGNGVQRVSLTTGVTQATINVTPSPTVAFDLNPGATTPKDLLRIHRTDVIGGALTRDPSGSGAYTSTNRMPVTFAGIREVQLVPALVVGRHVFYNNSAFDGADPAANAADDGAIATDKAALLPGRRAAFANVTSYNKGINGVMIDIDSRGDGPAPTRADFQFTTRYRPAASGWVAAPEPASITLRRGAGAGGSDRVTITWPDGAITNTWLRVTVLPGPRTGLMGGDTFSVGNLVAETSAGNTAAGLIVNSFDFSRTRAAMFSDAGVTSPFDFNRDGRVSPIDLAISRSNQRRVLELFPSAPSGGVPPLAVSPPAARPLEAQPATGLLEEGFS